MLRKRGLGRHEYLAIVRSLERRKVWARLADRLAARVRAQVRRPGSR